jgi:ketosteroid isomerase-like protein
MKTKILTAGLFGVILALCLSCTQNKEVKSIDKDLVKAEIQAIENQFALIYNTRNADSLTYYADDAVSYFVGQKPLVGKVAIHQFIENELKEFPIGAKISNETLEIFVTDDGNNVAEVGAYKQVDSTGKILQTGHYFSFFTKRNGKYVCTRDMANSYPPDSE